MVRGVSFSNLVYIDIIQIYDLPAVLADEIYIRINIRLYHINIWFAARFSRCESLEDSREILFASWLIVAYRLRSNRSNKLMADKYTSDCIGYHWTQKSFVIIIINIVWISSFAWINIPYQSKLSKLSKRICNVIFLSNSR